MLMVMWNFNAKLVFGCSPKLLQLGLVDKSTEGFPTLCNAPESLPSRSVEKAKLLGIDCTSNWISFGYLTQGFVGSLPCLPFNQNIVGGSLVGWIIMVERALMCSDCPESPWSP